MKGIRVPGEGGNRQSFQADGPQNGARGRGERARSDLVWGTKQGTAFFVTKTSCLLWEGSLLGRTCSLRGEPSINQRETSQGEINQSVREALRAGRGIQVIFRRTESELPTFNSHQNQKKKPKPTRKPPKQPKTLSKAALFHPQFQPGLPPHFFYGRLLAGLCFCSAPARPRSAE